MKKLVQETGCTALTQFKMGLVDAGLLPCHLCQREKKLLKPAKDQKVIKEALTNPSGSLKMLEEIRLNL